jgi:single-stranded-DNA-specific exonuclease
VGCTLKKEFANEEGVAALSEGLRSFAAARLTPALLTPEIPIDATLPIESLSLSLCDQLEMLAPYGIGNPLPIFASRGVKVLRGPWILKDQHLKLQARANGIPVDVIWWRHAQAAEQLGVGTSFDVTYSVSRNSYMGQESILLTVKDLRC